MQSEDETNAGAAPSEGCRPGPFMTRSSRFEDLDYEDRPNAADGFDAAEFLVPYDVSWPDAPSCMTP